MRPVATDLLRLLAAAGVPVAAVSDGVVGAALMMLVLGGCMVPRCLGLTPALDVAFCLTCIGAAWAALLDGYARVGGLDLVVHTVLTGLLAVVVLGLLRRTAPRASAPAVGAAALVTTLALALLWELGEHLGHTHLDERIQVGRRDTAGDLVAGAVGALTALVFAARSKEERR